MSPPTWVFYRQFSTGVWRGAVLASVLWFLATKGFATYVRHIAKYNVMYGSIGASIALLVWMLSLPKTPAGHPSPVSSI